MKDLLLCVHVIVKTLNLEISRFHLADYVKELYESACRTCNTITFYHSTNQIIVFWRPRCRRPCLSSLMESSLDLKLLSTCHFRADEEAFVSDRDELPGGHDWERVCRMCDFNPKGTKNTKDVSRMRSIFLQLKQTPLAQ